MSPEYQISESFVNLIVILAYITVILTIPYIMVEEGHPIEWISNFLDRVWCLLVLIWTFKVSSRMNTLFDATEDQPHRFHGLGIFLFSVFYFNFKINKLNKDLA